MTKIHGKVKTTQKIGGSVKSTSAVNGELDDSVNERIYKDYNNLKNKPSINGVELIGNKTSEDLNIPYVFVNTTEYWNSQPTLITIKGAVYVYTDYEKDGEGNDVPGLKVGDGLGYLIDAPFTSDPYYNHIRNSFIHITPEEREKWNNKVRCYIDVNDIEKLVFTTD